MNIGELLVRIGTIGNSKEVKAFGEAVKKAGKAIDDFDKKVDKTSQTNVSSSKSILKLVGAIAGIATAVGVAYSALDRLTASLIQNNNQWMHLIRQSDIALETFQKWDTVGKIVGIDNVAQQIEDLNQKIFKARVFGEGYEGWAWAGVMPSNSDDVLEQLRNRVKNLNNTQAKFILEKMGLNPELITLLRLGKEEWQEYLDIQKNYTLNREQREEIDKLNRQLQIASIRMQYLRDRLALAVLPAFVRFKKFIVSAVEGLIKFIDIIRQSNSPIAIITKGLLGIATALGVVRVALLAISAHPIVAGISAIIGAIMLLADDLNQYFSGGKSVIGFLEKALKEIDLYGWLNIPLPKWLEAIIRFIDFYEKHKSLFIVPAVGIPSAVTSVISDMNKDDKLKTGMTDFVQGQSTFADKDKYVSSAISGQAKTEIRKSSNNWDNNTTNMAYNTLNQTNYIQTTEAMSELESSLLFFKQRAISIG